MNILSVYAHHEPSSFTGALKNTATSILTAQGHSIVESDLYAMGFSAKAEKYDFNVYSGGHFNYMLEQRFAANKDIAFAADITDEIEKILRADIIMFHAPIWWFSVPAVLKGWFDRTLAMGVAWDGGKIYEKGLLRGKTAFMCAVAGGPKDFYRPDGRHRATIEQILHPIHHGTFAFCGMDVYEPFIVFNSLGLNSEERARVLREYQFKIENLITSPIYLSKYD